MKVLNIKVLIKVSLCPQYMTLS